MRALHWREHVERLWSSPTRLSTVEVVVSGHGESELLNRCDSVLLHRRARLRSISERGLGWQDWPGSKYAHAA